ACLCACSVHSRPGGVSPLHRSCTEIPPQSNAKRPQIELLCRLSLFALRRPVYHDFCNLKSAIRNFRGASMPLPISRVVLYKHGVGYFEREGKIDGDAVLPLTFKQSEVSDVLKSLTVLDLDGGHIASVSYDSTKPLEQLLAEVALSIPDQGSLVKLLPQIKGARVALHSGVADPLEGAILGIDTTERQTGDGIVHVVLLSVLCDQGDVRQVDLHSLAAVQVLDPTLKRDLDFYLKTQLSAKKKDARTFTFFAQGQGQRTIRVSYTLEAPVWKATYRILLGEEGK